MTTAASPAASPSRGDVKRARRSTPVAALPLASTLLVNALACGDATGPAPESGHPVFVHRATHLPEIWEYVGRSERRIAIDSAGRIDDVAASHDGRLAVSTAVQSATLSAIIETTTDGRWLRTLRPAQPSPSAHGMAYSPDGRRIAWYATYARIDSLFVLDLASGTPRALLARPTPFARPLVRWTPSGSIVFEDDTALVSVDAATGAKTTVFANQDTIVDFDVAADGRLVVATRARTSPSARLRAQREVGGPLLPIDDPANTDRATARWSPDGRLVATTAVEDVLTGGVVRRQAVPDVLGLSGERHRVPTAGAAFSGIAGWTPDGRLAFFAYPPSSGDTYARFDVYIAMPGGATANLTRTPAAFEDMVAIPR